MHYVLIHSREEDRDRAEEGEGKGERGEQGFKV